MQGSFKIPKEKDGEATKFTTSSGWTAHAPGEIPLARGGSWGRSRWPHSAQEKCYFRCRSKVSEFYRSKLLLKYNVNEQNKNKGIH